MPKPRVIVKRRKAVRNIHKITRTMQLIATSKFRRAHARAAATRPYNERVADLVRLLDAAAPGEFRHPLLERRPLTADLLLVLTSNRGLCAGYNASILRAAIAHCRTRQGEQREVRLEVVGKKGIGYLRFLGLPLEATYTDIGDKPTFAHVERLAGRYMDLFAHARDVDAVHVAYMKFVSAGVQRPTVATLLPVDLAAETAEEQAEPPEADAAYLAGQRPPRPLDDYEFSPGPEALLGELLAILVKVRLFEFLNDAVVSEQVARMTAMKAATENAEDMIKTLTQQYHRARQSQITREISEIIGGAEALA